MAVKHTFIEGIGMGRYHEDKILQCWCQRSVLQPSLQSDMPIPRYKIKKFIHDTFKYEQCDADTIIYHIPDASEKAYTLPYVVELYHHDHEKCYEENLIVVELIFKMSISEFLSGEQTNAKFFKRGVRI